MRGSSPSRSTDATARRRASRDRGDAEVGEREPVAAEQHRRDVGEHLVDEARAQERARERGSALDEDALDAALAQLGEHGGRSSPRTVQKGARMPAHGRAVGHRARRRARRERGWCAQRGRRRRRARSARGRPRAPCRCRPRSRRPRRGGGGRRRAPRAGDPLARAVGCRGPAVEALRPLHGDVRAAESLHGRATTRAASVASSARTPGSTSTPAARRRSPPPDDSGPGSATA